MRLEKRMEARSVHFPLIAVTGYQSHAVRHVELIFLYGTFRTPNTLLRISLSKQKRIAS